MKMSQRLLAVSRTFTSTHRRSRDLNVRPADSVILLATPTARGTAFTALSRRIQLSRRLVAIPLTRANTESMTDTTLTTDTVGQRCADLLNAGHNSDGRDAREAHRLACNAALPDLAAEIAATAARLGWCDDRLGGPRTNLAAFDRTPTTADRFQQEAEDWATELQGQGARAGDYIDRRQANARKRWADLLPEIEEALAAAALLVGPVPEVVTRSETHEEECSECAGDNECSECAGSGEAPEDGESCDSCLGSGECPSCG